MIDLMILINQRQRERECVLEGGVPKWEHLVWSVLFSHTLLRSNSICAKDGGGGVSQCYTS